MAAPLNIHQDIDFHWHLPCHNICGWILPAGYRLMLSLLLYCPFMHSNQICFRVVVSQKRGYMKWKSKHNFIQHHLFCARRLYAASQENGHKTKRTGEYQQNKVAVGELAPDLSVIPLWIAFSQLQSTTAASLATYFRSSWYLSSGQPQRDHMIIATGMIPQSQLGERTWHSNVRRCEIHIGLLENNHNSLMKMHKAWQSYLRV